MEFLKNVLATSPRKSLHAILKPVLLIAQCLGILPVDGILTGESTGVRFRWKSAKVVYTILILTLASLMSTLSAVRMLRKGISFNTTGDVIFYSCSTMVIAFFLVLATKWPQLMSQWRYAEEVLAGVPYKSNISCNIHSILTIILTLSLVEHCLANLGTVLNGAHCYKSFWGVLKYYYTNAFRQVFTVIEYSPFVGVLCSYTVLVSTLAWNFMDLIIIVLSLALNDAVQHFNSMMTNVKGEDSYYYFWKKSREMFNRLSLLTKTLDRHLSPIVLLSFASNLYFICFQLLHNLKPPNSTIQGAYFVLSFGYLLLRTCAVSMSAATIHGNSRNSLSVLFSVTTECYNTEVERLITQMISDELALTGCKFFTVTRTFILTVAGTIVTYEIVLLQLNGNNPEFNSPPKNITCPPLD